MDDFTTITGNPDTPELEVHPPSTTVSVERSYFQ